MAATSGIAGVAAGPTAAELAEAELVEVMREIFATFDGTDGEPRMTIELANRGRVVNHKRVRRLMRLHGIVGVHKPAKVRTTVPAEANPPLRPRPKLRVCSSEVLVRLKEVGWWRTGRLGRVGAGARGNCLALLPGLEMILRMPGSFDESWYLGTSLG